MRNSRFKGQDQEIAEARYRSEAFDKAGAIKRKHVIWTITDWRLYAQAAIYVPTAALLSSISGFLPTIVSGEWDAYVSVTLANQYRFGIQRPYNRESDDRTPLMLVHLL